MTTKMYAVKEWADYDAAPYIRFISSNEEKAIKWAKEASKPEVLNPYFYSVSEVQCLYEDDDYSIPFVFNVNVNSHEILDIYISDRLGDEESFLDSDEMFILIKAETYEEALVKLKDKLEYL